MSRLLVLLLWALVSVQARADAFDNYINTILARVPQADGVLKLKQLTSALLTEHSGAIPGTTAAFLVVKTGEGRWSKLLVQPAAQKINAQKSLPILHVERFVTYREGEEKMVHARGDNVRLFPDFHLSLDIGQVVPAEVGGDLRFRLSDGKGVVEPVGQAEFYLLTKPLPEAKPKKSDKLVVGQAFEVRYFNGKYKLHEDGRRSGTLVLKVGENNTISGYFYSDKDGAKYEVEGKAGNPPHAIQFMITFPRTEQTFTGWMFTGNGQIIAGSARWQGRETGFYAQRIEE